MLPTIDFKASRFPTSLQLAIILFNSNFTFPVMEIGTSTLHLATIITAITVITFVLLVKHDLASHK